MLLNQLCDGVCVEDFYPVTVRVLYEREIFHGALVGFFDERDAQ